MPALLPANRRVAAAARGTRCGINDGPKFTIRAATGKLRDPLSAKDFGGNVAALNAARAHSHYFKDVSRLQTIDVYRALALFNVTDPCLQHAVKKLLVAGGRGGGKDISRDVQEAIDTLKRWQEMRAEEAAS